jgi:hypothetical protein
VSPARWLSQHPETLTASASRKLPQGAVLHGNADGQRWITPDAGRAAADGGAGSPQVETAPMILPERIEGILAVGQRWAFFGTSGRAFIAASPLGAIEEVRTPPAPGRATAVGDAAAVLATLAGDLLRSTDGGAHWAPVQAAGLSPAVPISVALRADGAGVLLAAPQRALYTTDDGATWAPLGMPGGGPYLLDVSARGDIWLTPDRYQAKPTHRFDARPPAFTPDTPTKMEGHRRADEDAIRYEQDPGTLRAVSGKRLLAVGRPRVDDPWKIESSELDRAGAWRAVPELENCSRDFHTVSAFGDDFVLGCVRSVGEPPRYRMVFYRSKDGGSSWTEDGEVPLWTAWGKALAGPEERLLVRRWSDSKVPGRTPLALRAGAGQPFAPLETEADAMFEMIALDAIHGKWLAVGRDVHRKEARLYTWSLDGRAGPVTDLFSTAEDLRGTLTVDEHGAIVLMTHVFVDEKAPGAPPAVSGWKVFRSSDEGATFQSSDLAPEINVNEVALAGERGLLRDQSGRYWETASSGKTWAPVTGLRSRGSHPLFNELVCGREGCAVGTERRLGWDLATEAAPAPLVGAPLETRSTDEVAGATPLRCVAGAPRALSRALVEDLDDVAVTGSTGGGHFTVAVATQGEGVQLVAVSASDDRIATKTTALFGPAPNRKVVGSQTGLMTTAAGVVAIRNTYPVDSSEADVWISPVTAELAWWRPQTGKVIHATLPPLGKGYMDGRLILGQRALYGTPSFATHSEGMLGLTPDAVVYRPGYLGTPSSDQCRSELCRPMVVNRPGFIGAGDIFTVTDTGRSEKVVSPLLLERTTAIAPVRTSSGLVLLSLDATGGFGVVKDEDEAAGLQAVWRLAPPSSSPTVLPLQRGDEAAFVVAWSGPADSLPRGFVVPARPGNDPPVIADLDLDGLLGERPRVCGEGQPLGAVRLKVELPRALRRPVLVEGGDKPALMRVEAVVVMVPVEGPACVSEWLARGATGSEIAVIPLAPTSRAWSLSGTDAKWEAGVRSRKLSVRALRCEEAAGLAIPASFAWKGF